LGTPNAPAASLRTGDPAVSDTATQFAVGGPATKRVRTFRRVGVRVTGKGRPPIGGHRVQLSLTDSWRKCLDPASMVSDMPTERSRFRMGRLDHVHIRVPDRAEAARWYSEHLGFEPVDKYDFWATGFKGGPLQISADGGETMLALFEASEGHPMVPQQTGIAFSVDADTFISFARSLPSGIDSPRGDRLILTDLVDFDMCWAFDLVDPWGNQYELNCYDYERIRAELVEADAVEVVRYWPRELYAVYPSPTSS